MNINKINEEKDTRKVDKKKVASNCFMAGSDQNRFGQFFFHLIVVVVAVAAAAASAFFIRAMDFSIKFSCDHLLDELLVQSL